VAVGKVVAHLCLTIMIKELKINGEHDRGGNNTNYNQTLNILFSVVFFIRPLGHVYDGLVDAEDLRFHCLASPNMIGY
jgi:hypothetical protein